MTFYTCLFTPTAPTVLFCDLLFVMPEINPSGSDSIDSETGVVFRFHVGLGTRACPLSWLPESRPMSIGANKIAAILRETNGHAGPDQNEK